jgi:2-polyprenyl-3-methyl-5-hydroxy-6-metoxy-1,4-benzoquinol methylase
MTYRATDPEYLHYQYDTAEKLRIRQETHDRYSERPNDFLPWVLDHLDPQPGQRVVDVGCGPGIYHPLLADRGVNIVAVDASYGMVSEVKTQAQTDDLPVVAAQARAEQLPLADGCCERAMANHMLYHVPDQLAALRELRRILKPGGRVVLATNAADAYQRLTEIHVAAAREACFTPSTQSLTERFSLDHLALVQQVFPGAQVAVRADALLFPDVDAALRYYATAKIDQIQDAPADGSHRQKLLPIAARHIHAIIEREGIFRVPKNAGCFWADG